MKKAIRIAAVFMLCGLAMLTLLGSAGIASAASLVLRPIQVQSSGYTDSQGTLTVFATCPQDYRVQSGSAQITPSNQGQVSAYRVSFNGPNAQKSAWVTTVENQKPGSLSITVTATCVAK